MDNLVKNNNMLMLTKASSLARMNTGKIKYGCFFRQKGMSMWSWSFVLGVIALFSLAAITVSPMYLNQFKVKSHLDSLAADPSIASMTKIDIVSALGKRFAIDNVDYINPKKDIQVKYDKKTKTRKIMISYEVRAKFLGNIFIVADFTNTEIEIAGK